MPVIHLRVEGRVQGVGFRWFVCDRAVAIGLAGWVRNTESGDVEVAASGASAQIEALVRVVGQGPAGARVDVVHRVSPPADISYPSPFRIEI